MVYFLWIVGSHKAIQAFLGLHHALCLTKPFNLLLAYQTLSDYFLVRCKWITRLTQQLGLPNIVIERSSMYGQFHKQMNHTSTDSLVSITAEPLKLTNREIRSQPYLCSLKNLTGTHVAHVIRTPLRKRCPLIFGKYFQMTMLFSVKLCRKHFL